MENRLCKEEFNFDLMAKLAKEAPSDFAMQRNRLIRQTIQSMDCQERGHKAQSEIDLMRLSTSQGDKTCLAIAKEIAMLVHKLQIQLKNLQSLKTENNK